MKWYDVYPPTCKYCRSKYEGRTPPEKPPCHACEEELLDENKDAAKIYIIARHQVITNMGRIMDIDIKAVKALMDIYKVVNQVDCLDRVRGVFYHFVGKK